MAVTLQTPRLPIARLRDLGYRVVIIPSDHQRAAIRAMEDVLAAIKKDGHSAALAERMAAFKEREENVATASYSPATSATPRRRGGRPRG